MCIVPVQGCAFPRSNTAITRATRSTGHFALRSSLPLPRLTEGSIHGVQNPSAPESDSPTESRGGRPRGSRIEVWVTPEERATIIEQAARTGLSQSAYLRALGLNTPVRAIADIDAVMELLRLNADLGRLGGLLKLWLSEQPGRGVPVPNVRELLHKIEATQHQMFLQAAKVQGRKR